MNWREREKDSKGDYDRARLQRVATPTGFLSISLPLVNVFYLLGFCI